MLFGTLAKCDNTIKALSTGFKHHAGKLSMCHQQTIYVHKNKHGSMVTNVTQSEANLVH